MGGHQLSGAMRIPLLLAASLLIALPTEAQRTRATTSTPARATTSAPARAASGAQATVSATAWQSGNVPVVRLEASSGARATGHRRHLPARQQGELTDDQRRLLLAPNNGGLPGGSGQVLAEPEPVIQHLRLSAAQMSHPLGYLEFNGTLAFDMSQDVVEILTTDHRSSDFDPRVTLNARLEAGERYLVDFHIRTNRRAEYRLSGPGAALTYELSPAQTSHLLLIVEPQHDSWYTVRVAPKEAYAGGRFKVYGAEISRLD